MNEYTEAGDGSVPATAQSPPRSSFAQENSSPQKLTRCSLCGKLLPPAWIVQIRGADCCLMCVPGFAYGHRKMHAAG